MDSLIGYLKEWYHNHELVLLFSDEDDNNPVISCNRFGVCSEYMDGTEPCYDNGRVVEIEGWLATNGYLNDGNLDIDLVMWTNLAVMAAQYRDFRDFIAGRDGDYYSPFDEYHELSLMGGINWQLDMLRKRGAADYDFDSSAIIDPSLLNQLTEPEHFTPRITKLVEEFDLDLDEFIPES